jgi:spore germination protein KA
MKHSKNSTKHLLSFITYKHQKEIKKFYIPEVGEEAEQPDSKQANITVSTNIDRNIAFIKKSFHSTANKDIMVREFKIAGKYRAFIVYLLGMVDSKTISNFILRPLMENSISIDDPFNCQLDLILNSIVETNQTKKVTESEDAISEILAGNTGIYVDGCDCYIFCDTKGYEKRSVEKPQSEGTVKGSHEAFNENLRTNITLIRRIIKNKDLVTEILPVGDKNNSECAVIYISGLVNPSIVEEVKRRINSIKTDFVLGGGMLEQYIEDSPWSILPTILSTERPDRATSHIIEGRVAIIVEGSPFALIVPITLFVLLHTSEDSFLRWQYGMLLRAIRAFAVFVSLFLPGLYVALTNYHQEMIPTSLLIAIAKSRENVPFPTIIEILFMESAFELIREAGIRIPGIIGYTVGIVGALILGQAAVQANIISPILIIIIAFTGLGNFAIPDFSMYYGLRITRLYFIVLGSILGFLGISLGLISLTAVLTSLKSFGVPFLSPVAPRARKGTDVFLRFPIWKQELRPDSINPLDIRRQPKISREWTKEDANVPTRKTNSNKEKKHGQ